MNKADQVKAPAQVEVEPVEDDLLASIRERPRPIRMPREGLFDGIYPEHYYAREGR